LASVNPPKDCSADIGSSPHTQTELYFLLLVVVDLY